MPEKQAIGKIGGGMFILFLIILWVAAHGGSNEMMYITLLFVFIAIALFSYGFWSTVYKGEGVLQYMGKNNLQHQQISNPSYHFGSVKNYKSHPQKNVHICAPPKMGGARLEIYTIPLSQSTPSTPSRLPAHNQSSTPRHNSAALNRNPSVSSQHRTVANRQLSLNQSRRGRVRGSFRKKQESIDEQIKVEVYCDSDQSRQTDRQSQQDINTAVPKADNESAK